MFYQLLFIHLYRPFLKYTRANSPLPAYASPRKLCTQAASAISKLLRLYKRTYGFKQICNIAVYIAHTACTIHLLNLPEKNAQRDFVHGLRHLEEMGESWLCARRTLRILDISANKWQVRLPNEAAMIFEQTHEKWGSWGSWDQASSPSNSDIPSPMAPPPTVTSQPLPSPERLAALSEHGGFPVSAPQPSMGAVSSRYPPEVSMSETLTAMRTAHRAASAQIARTDVPLPEPTYLRPLAHAYGALQPVPMAQHDAWYSPNEPQISAALSSGQSIPTTADSSPVNSFDTPENLVEESQDWFARDPHALNMAFGSYQSWNPGFAGPTSDIRFENYTSHSRQPSDPNNPSSRPPPQPAQQARFPTGMPSGVVRPDQGPAVAGYTNMEFPNGFQQ